MSSNFCFGKLELMTGFKGSGVQFLVPNIVRLEVVKNYAELLEAMSRAAKEALKKVHGHFGVVLSDMVGVLGKIETDKYSDIASKSFDLYAGECGAVFLSDSVVASRIVEDYMEGNPPFGGGKKKCEFPDAIALHAIDLWSNVNRSRVLVVSNDKGWLSYCDGKENLCCVEGFPEALDILNAQDWPRRFVNGLVEFLRDDRSDDFKLVLLDEIGNIFQGKSVNVESYSSLHMYIDADGYVESCDSLSFVGDGDGNARLLLAEVRDDSISVSCTVTVVSTLQIDIDLSVWDGVDRETISLPSQSRMVGNEFDVDLTIRFEIDRDAINIDYNDLAIEVDCDPVSISVDIGEVAPFEGRDYEE